MPRKLVLSVVALVLMFIAGCGSSQAPSTPTLAVTTSGGVMALSWTASSGASSYIVFRGASPQIYTKSVLASGLTGTSYTDSTAVGGTTYYYQVTAVNSDGQSSPSNDVTAIGPIVLSISATTTNMLTWVGDPAAASYSVYRSTSSDMTGSSSLLTGSTALTFSDKIAATSTTYYYQVEAFDSTTAKINLSNIISITY